jgi:hypothetical protein
MCLLLRSGFRLATLPYRPDWWSAAEMVDQGPSPPIAQFSRAASFRTSLGVSKRFPFKNNGGHFVLGDLQSCRHFLLPFPRSMPRHNHVSELYEHFLRPHGLLFALTCTVICGTLYRCVYLSKTCLIN